MGQTDTQFKAFIRQLFKRIKQVVKLLDKADSEEAKAELRDILDDLQKSLED